MYFQFFIEYEHFKGEYKVIRPTQITQFNDLDSFTYFDGKKQKTFNGKKGFHFNKPVLALDKNNHFVIKFENIFDHLFSKLFDLFLNLFHIGHGTTDPQKVWKELKKIHLVNENEQFPETNQKIRVLFSEKIGRIIKLSQATWIDQSDRAISIQDFQKFILYIQENDLERAKELIDSMQDLNDYFAQSFDTPLTLALKKENFEVLKYLFSKKDQDGQLLVNPNKPTIDKKSPLLLATKQDLPRRFFMLLFEAGAKPQNEIELHQIIEAAGGKKEERNQKLIQAVHDCYGGKSISWPVPIVD